MKTRILASMALVFMFLILAAAPALADTIRLKNGTVIKGKVTSFAGGSFTVTIELGSSSTSRATIDMRDVDTIEFDGRSEEVKSGTSSPPRQAEPEDDGGDRTTSPPVTTPSRPAPANPGSTTSPGPTTSTTSPVSRPSSAIPKEVVVSVPARDDWTYASLVVRRGDRILVSATGKVKLSSTREAGPEGVSIDDKDKLLVEKPTGGLIAVIGDDNDDFVYIGREGEFVATRDGKLFLSVNEGDLSDNDGSFSVRIKIETNR
jgi:hypothetical protein